MNKPIDTLVVLGGGTAGWMTAAMLSRLLGTHYRIRLVESDEIGTIGVGEATIPQIKNFNAALGIDLHELLRRTQGTFKLGIEFVDWARLGDAYIHGFGRIGQDSPISQFHQFWLKQFLAGEANDLGRFSINTVAPHQAKFMRPLADMPGSPLGEIASAIHFDAHLYAKFLRGYAEQRGVVRTEGKVARVLLREGDGFIEALQLQSGEKIAGDLFVDCSGLRALLIGDALGVGFEDWNHWLPCDRAVAVPCESAGPLLPLTRSTARGAGWQWRIPLQHRIGNGHVYSSRHLSDDEATAVLLANLDGKPLADPRPIRFRAGRRKLAWHRNCIAIGLASGFLEPLESTSIHLVQTAITRLLRFFPDASFDAAGIDRFNRETREEWEYIRDFLVLHYKATERDDTAFWTECRTMPVPERLQSAIDLFRGSGRICADATDLFAEPSWLQVMIGQRILPRGYDPLVDLASRDEIVALLENVESVIRKCVEVMPLHADYIATHCAAM